MLLVVMDGCMMQDVEGIDHAVSAGSAMIVPSYYMHRGYVHGDRPAVLFELFAPVRHDYIDLNEYQKQAYPDDGAPWVRSRDAFTWTTWTKNDTWKKRPPLYKLAELPVETRLHEGRMRRKSLRTQQAQVVWAEITPQPRGKQGHHRAPQDHPHDMLLICNKGRLRIEIGGKEQEMPPGSAIIVPPFTMHRCHAVGDEIVELMEIFSPPRLDYAHLVQWQLETFLDSGQAWVNPEYDSWNKPPGL
jgi:quercetin dioxygenase-like cupin family protein